MRGKEGWIETFTLTLFEYTGKAFAFKKFEYAGKAFAFKTLEVLQSNHSSTGNYCRDFDHLVF